LIGRDPFDGPEESNITSGTSGLTLYDDTSHDGDEEMMVEPINPYGPEDSLDAWDAVPESLPAEEAVASAALASGPRFLDRIPTSRPVRSNLYCVMCGGTDHSKDCDFDRFFHANGGARVDVKLTEYKNGRFWTRKGQRLFPIQEPVEYAWARVELREHAEQRLQGPAWLDHPSCPQATQDQAEACFHWLVEPNPATASSPAELANLELRLMIQRAGLLVTREEDRVRETAILGNSPYFKLSWLSGKPESHPPPPIPPPLPVCPPRNMPSTNLYQCEIPFSPSAALADADTNALLHSWHRALGHLHLGGLIQLAKDGKLLGLSEVTSEQRRTWVCRSRSSSHSSSEYTSDSTRGYRYPSRPRSVPSSPVLRSLSPRTPSCSPPPSPLPPAEDPPTLPRPEGPPPMVWDLEDRTTTIRVTLPDRLFWVPPPSFLVLGPYEVPHPPRRYYDAAVLSHMVIRTSDDDDLGQLIYLIRYLADWRQPNSEVRRWLTWKEVREADLVAGVVAFWCLRMMRGKPLTVHAWTHRLLSYGRW
ncbi:hypothetical protein B9479_007609, partial [Cryptococcus floricola]